VGSEDVGTREYVDVRTRAVDDEKPLVREHAAWAPAQIGAR
jgi:hypothetical protein